MQLLKDKISVITGSNSGIGLSILEVFLENGSEIFACYRNMTDEFKNKINTLEKRNNGIIHLINLDLNNDDSIKNAFDEISKKTNNIDNLINCAGILENSIFQMTSKKKYEKYF